jgi:rRNA maturation protein Nop10
MDERRCRNNHTWTGDHVCPECGELGALMSGGNREADHDRRARERRESES